jgi:hypothetical protein
MRCDFSPRLIILFLYFLGFIIISAGRSFGAAPSSPGFWFSTYLISTKTRHRRIYLVFQKNMCWVDWSHFCDSIRDQCKSLSNDVLPLDFPLILSGYLSIVRDKEYKVATIFFEPLKR